MKRALVCTLALGGILWQASQAQAISVTPITLDTFDTGSFTINQSLGTTTGTFNNTETSSEILGGERNVNFTITQHTIPERSAIAQVSGGNFILDLGPGVKTTASMTWDGIDTSGLNTDLTTGGLDAFKLGINLIDLEADLTFVVTDNQNRISTLTKTGLKEGNQFFQFQNFIGNADFKDVYSVKLLVDTPMSADLQLDFLESTKSSVPEPFTMLGSIAALGFGTAFRRKYQKKA